MKRISVDKVDHRNFEQIRRHIEDEGVLIPDTPGTTITSIQGDITFMAIVTHVEGVRLETVAITGKEFTIGVHRLIQQEKAG